MLKKMPALVIVSIILCPFVRLRRVILWALTSINKSLKFLVLSVFLTVGVGCRAAECFTSTDTD